ncbi:MAG TPA: sigma factor-like helix-turn-helix DNA-binding protein [Candidatus Gracilibacteria bacterium]
MTQLTQSQTGDKVKVDFADLLGRLLNILSDKEQDIIRRRFSLEGHQKETLDKIGKSFSITRERVRQIESVALKKLSRLALDPDIQRIHQLAINILQQHGQVMSEDHLVSEMVKFMAQEKKVDSNAMKLSMRVCDKLVKQEKNQFYRAFWRLSTVSLLSVRTSIREIQQILSKAKDVMSPEDIASQLPTAIPTERVVSLLQTDWSFKSMGGQWGMTTWRHINPKSIKDKIMIIFRREGEPMHFSEVANRVLDEFSSKKAVTRQAIHNELIRHEEFVLVGRGLYGLKEWGMVSGTVKEVIRKVLVENGGPMKRQEIIKAVQKRRDIRLGTISLNLQKYPFFKRVGRAVYEYDASLETKRKKRKTS